MIKPADDAGRSQFGLAEVIAAVAVAAKTAGLAQLVDRAGDLALLLGARLDNTVKLDFEPVDFGVQLVRN